MSNVSFVVKDLAGKVIRTGITDENLLDYQKMTPDETVEVYDPDQAVVGDDSQQVIILSHTHPRMMSFPGVTDQLDEMWKVLKENCTLTPSAKLMLERIEAVKSKYPKDQKYVQATDGSFVPYDSEQ